MADVAFQSIASSSSLRSMADELAERVTLGRFLLGIFLGQAGLTDGTVEVDLQRRSVLAKEMQLVELGVAVDAKETARHQHHSACDDEREPARAHFHRWLLSFFT